LVAPLTWGYWKNHDGTGSQANAWPLTNGPIPIAPGVTYTGTQDAQGVTTSSMTFGGHIYTIDQLESILATSVEGNALINLGHQLIAAILNVANGAGTPTAVSLIQQASDLLAANNLVIGVDVVSSKINKTLLAPFTDLASQLDAYNSSGV
jgi:hypothetical protein